MCSGDILPANADTDTLTTTTDLYQTNPMVMDHSSAESSWGLSKRRENSRFAARDRRGKEAELFAELREVTPIIEEQSPLGGAHIDRIALLRVAYSLCRLHSGNALKYEEERTQGEHTGLAAKQKTLAVWCEQTLTECLEGFIMIVHSDGSILYTSESVSLYLGLTQSDFVGCHLAEFVHRDDYEKLRAVPNNTSDGEGGHRMVARMKTVISQRGRVLNYKSALYKTIVVQRRWIDAEDSSRSGNSYARLMLIHASCHPAGQPPLPSMGPLSAPISLSLKDTPREQSLMGLFMTRHTCDMRFSFASEKFTRLVNGGTTNGNRTLLGTSYFDLVHPADLPSMLSAVGELFSKGHSRSGFYRLLCGRESVAWLQSEAITHAHTVKGQKGQYVLCLHHVLGTQSELDSWRPSTTEQQTQAAQPVLTNIKQETTDIVDYLIGRQPQFIDCFDFTPLIEPLPAGFTGENFYLHMDEYRPAQAPQQHSSPHQHSPSVEGGFDEDYAEMLVEWLHRDDPTEQCPDFNGIPLDSLPTNNPNGDSGGVEASTANLSHPPDFANLSAGRESTRKHALPAVQQQRRREEAQPPLRADVSMDQRPTRRIAHCHPIHHSPPSITPLYSTMSSAGGNQLAPPAQMPAAAARYITRRAKSNRNHPHGNNTCNSTLYSSTSESSEEDEVEIVDRGGEEHNTNIGVEMSVLGNDDHDDDLIEFQKCRAYVEAHGAELAPYLPLEESIPVLSEAIDVEGLFPELDLAAFQPATTTSSALTTSIPRLHNSALPLQLNNIGKDDEEDPINSFYRLVDATYEEEPAAMHAKGTTPPMKKCRLEGMFGGMSDCGQRTRGGEPLPPPTVWAPRVV